MPERTAHHIMRTEYTIAAIYIGTSYHSNVTVHHVQRYVTGAAGYHSKYLATGRAGPQLGQTTDGQMVRSPRLLASLPGPAASGGARAERTTHHVMRTEHTIAG